MVGHHTSSYRDSTACSCWRHGLPKQGDWDLHIVCSTKMIDVQTLWKAFNLMKANVRQPFNIELFLLTIYLTMSHSNIRFKIMPVFPCPAATIIADTVL